MYEKNSTFAKNKSVKMNTTTHKIINGDSRQMSELKDRSVHLTVTSPPYWQLKDYGTGWSLSIRIFSTIEIMSIKLQVRNLIL
jgi:DNA modification methylase